MSTMNLPKAVAASQSNPSDSSVSATAPASSQPAPGHRQRSSRSTSISSSSIVTVKRSASLRDTNSDLSHPHKRATPPPSRRRSSAAAGTLDGLVSLRDGVANLNRWSQSTTSSNRSAKEKGHAAHPSFSRKLSLPTNNISSLNGAAHPPSPSYFTTSSSPSRNNNYHHHYDSNSSSYRSPASSPVRRAAGPRSPVNDFDPPPSTLTTTSALTTLTATTYNPRSSSLGPLLPATVYDPNSPVTNTTSNSSNDSPSTAGLLTPSTYTTTNPSTSSTTDYFNSKPRSTPPAAATTSNSLQRPPSRSKADRVLGRSPLSSPAIGVLEAEARYRSNSGPGQQQQPQHSHSASASRPSTATAAPSASRDIAHRPSPSLQSVVSGGQHGRSISKDRNLRNRSESNSSNTTHRRDDSQQDTPPRTRDRREKDKKTMLSRALQKANTAVLLDNAQNFEGAMEAYGDACKLLQQVMIRSSGEDDRRKLDAIRVTYTNRIEELRRLDPGYGTTGNRKSLPARPMSNESLDEQRSMFLTGGDDDDEEPMIQTATMTRIVNDRPPDDRREPEPPPPNQLPFRMNQPPNARESVITTAIRDVQKNMGDSSTQFMLQPPPGRLANPMGPLGTPGLESPMDRSYMPPPLSPRRPISPLPSSRKDSDVGIGIHGGLLQPEPPAQSGHRRVHSSESISWLDTIDESGGSSCSSSVHSMSPGGPRRKHLRHGSGATEAEFDAALDAAVEAAYGDDFEPFQDDDDDDDMPAPSDVIATKLRNVELAKERVREAEREEAIAAAKYRYKETQLRNDALPHVRESAEFNFSDEAEEEERLLDEMTREYMLDGFDFDLQNKSSLPRQSDSSGFSGSTYNSSVSSHRTTGGTSLSTVTEVMYPPKPKPPPSHSPPPLPISSGPLPSVSETQVSQPTESSQTTPRPPPPSKDNTSVRNRRLSGQNAKTLKIETSLPPVPPAPHTEKAPPPPPEKEPRPDVPPLPKSASAATFGTTQPTIDPTFKVPALPQSLQVGLAAPSPNLPLPSPADTLNTVSPVTPALSHAMSNDTTLAPGSPKNGKSSAMGIRKNKSSLSLKQRTLSISSPDGSDGSVGTPLSTSFSMTGRKQSNAALPPAPTPSIPTFNVDGLPSGGMHLFESDIHSPYSPGSPSGGVTNAPIPLEPCPDSYLLRPFWLMRCFYQTIAHPRGGYLSTKLFIPRDVWRVKGVKLKNLDDKIANCDLLTAALQRLATVDTFDADAVLEEMQALEVVLDQVQTQLAKKLGNEVGVQGVTSLFKDANPMGDGTSLEGSGKGSFGSSDNISKSAVSQSKSYLTSWRKLRSKNSAIGLSNMGGGKGTNEVPKDSLVMSTLPMTSLPNIRFAKRDVSNVVFEGPNSGYMSSLAKLFDSVQILDQIARQVEDPGLKHSSPTHVGLELSARHAAEFFGFYICRFVLADVTLMLDKFIKRGSEWVLV